MGYSISVDCRSAKLQKRMLDLLEAEFRPWNMVLTGKECDRYISDPTSDLDYARHKNQVGFNYGSWGGDDQERFYYWSALRWMALKAGKRRRKFKSYPTFRDPVPYTIYDGDEPWPLLLKCPQRKKNRWLWVDDLGMQCDPEVVCGRFHGWFLGELIEFEPGKSVFDGARWRERVVPHLLKGKDGQPLQNLRKQQTHLVAELHWSELCELLVPIREELQRLDNLWGESV